MIRKLKRPKVGLEVEVFILDSNGYPTAAADRIIKNCPASDRKYALRKEYAKHILEIGAFPRVRVVNAAHSFIENMEAVLDTAEKLDLKIYPFGTFPGHINSQTRNEPYYILQEIIHGQKFVKAASYVAGFHLHYELPRGVLNRKTHQLRTTTKSKLKRAFINEYNFLVAADPVLSTFMQSSPFIDGQYFVKDTRNLLYRDMKIQVNGKEIQGIYKNMKILGSLPHYLHTTSDLNYIIQKRETKWKKLIENAGLSVDMIPKEKSILDFYWGPLRVNKLGTFEQRGMDMNYVSHIFAIATMIRHTLKGLYKNEIRVQPSDTGNKQAFKLEDDVLLIPSFTKVKDDLQYKATKKGLESSEIHNYCTRFYKLAKKFTDGERAQILKPVRQMLRDRETVSDKIIKHVKKKGYSLKDTLPQDVCAEIAIKFSDRMYKDLEQAKKNVHAVELGEH